MNRPRNVDEGQAQEMQSRRRKRIVVWIALGGLMLTLVTLLARPALAAIQLSYFYVIPNPASVILQWGTTSEFNVQGFEVQCKLASDPDIAFHRIGFVEARGGPSTPAQYNFPVLTGVEPGVAYCFRLQEITTDGTQGEAPTVCGYGPNVTPTPGVGVIPTTDPNAAPPIATDAFGNPIVAPTPDPFFSPVQPVATDAFGNPIPQTFDAFGNPIPQTFDAFGNPIPQPQATDAFGNPLPQPLATDAFGSPLPQPFATDAFSSPLPQPFATDAFGNPVSPAGVMVDEFGNPIPVDAFGSPLATPTPTIDPFAPPTPIVITPPPGAPRGNDPSAMQPAPTDPAVAQMTGGALPPTSAPPVAYIVVTAAPTEPPVALGAVMTPLPTITPTPPAYQLANVLAPTAQNVMIMLLCLTFTGASGIGILGLITSVMFMRSRAAQREFYDRYSLPPSRRRQW
ncbi:MAG TPA: hypothetical protein GYA08_15115 [Chloroflexi bacterium]|nr:hypothetical protein [Chloroflexota bacterium]